MKFIMDLATTLLVQKMNQRSNQPALRCLNCLITERGVQQSNVCMFLEVLVKGCKLDVNYRNAGGCRQPAWSHCWGPIH